MSSNSTSMSPQQILKRLEELRKWQDEQQQLLIQRQNSQRQLLDEEQRVLYKKLGFASPMNKLEVAERFGSKENYESSFTVSEVSSQLYFDGIEAALSNSNGRISLSDFGQSADIKDQSGDNHASKPANDGNDKHIKRRFLKKGEGLTNRFKINPEKFRLHNLPKYKYAPKHKKAFQARLAESLPKKFTSKEPCSSNAHTHESNRTRDTNNESTENASFAMNTRNEFFDKSKKKVEFSSVNSCATFEKGLGLARDKKATTLSANPAHEDADLQSINKSRTRSPISWADVLNPNNIKPISFENLRKYVELNSSETSLVEDDFDNLSLFELLEKKAQEGSILIDSSILQRYIDNLNNEPAIESLVDTQTINLMKNVSPLPFDIDAKILAQESEESSESDENLASPAKLAKCRVRFSDDIIVNEITSESESDESLLLESKTSTPSDKDICRSQSAPFLEEDSIIDTEKPVTLANTSMNDHEKKLIEKTDHLKARLADLEREISEFQWHNTELLKLKQECELERIQLEQEKTDLSEKLKDEQTKLEIRLHDERIKLEEERKKYEKMIKEHRLKSRKECEEITKLKEQVEHLQKENREKESKHTAAQARLRAQIRNLEKDLKEFSMEIDVLKKEKRRLEGENSRLMRQNNSKMLQEINKSIAKLVPKASSTETEAKNKNTKPVAAKVTSYPNNSPRQHVSKEPTTAHIVPRPNKPDDVSDNDSDPTENGKSAYFRNKRHTVKTSEAPNNSSDFETEPAKQEYPVEVIQREDELKREITNSDGSKDIWYTNGNLKKISADGMLIRMLYYNKDIKETNINEGTVKYYYAETNTWHTTYLDGLEILEFPNGQTEHRYKDGTIEVHFENGSIRITDPKDPAKLEEWRYADGTRLIQLKTGDKIISFPNGQKEVHTKVHKRREYPDGTVKIVYPDGSQETRYSNGRVRLKDKDGNLIMDSVS